jgi:aspartate-semialdehyde dehydrogenase
MKAEHVAGAPRSGLKVAIVGATGAVGEELLRVLEERRFPVGELLPMASERSDGRSLDFRGARVPVRRLDVDALKTCDVVFLSAGASLSRSLAPELLRGRPRLYDNTSAFRLDPDVALVVPEVNGARLTREHRHAAVANCTAILLVMALAPLHRRFGLERVVVSTYQAVSGAGRRAVERLLAELKQELAGRPLEAAPGAPLPFAFNCIPSIGDLDPGAGPDDVAARTTGEERKVAAEVRRILETPKLPIVATCVRVPVLRAHSESVLVELVDEKATLADVLACFRGAAGVELRDDVAHGVIPTPRAGAGIDGIHVGRVRPADRPGAFTFFLVGDQLRKGAALTAVQLAELQLDRIP